MVSLIVWIGSIFFSLNGHSRHGGISCILRLIHNHVETLKCDCSGHVCVCGDCYNPKCHQYRFLSLANRDSKRGHESPPAPNPSNRAIAEGKLRRCAKLAGMAIVKTPAAAASWRMELNAPIRAQRRTLEPEATAIDKKKEASTSVL